jgi:endonuclease/exonuclease/phosphatase (EEP) superfamily protein YafD
MKIPGFAWRDLRPKRLLAIVAWLNLLAVFAVAVCLLVFADTWWPATVLLFAPRWIWAAPLAVLIPAALVMDRKLLLPLGLAGYLVLFPVMGLELPSPGVVLADKSKRDVRIMTYNVGGGELDPNALAPLLARIGPDVALFQECGHLFEGARPALLKQGWHVDVQYGSCIASRHPIRAVDARDLKDVWQMGGSGIIVRYEIALPGIPLNVINMHLETVRDGLQAVIRRAPWRGAAQLRANIRQRDLESSFGRAWTARATGPLVLTGDFNMPVESSIYQTYWSSFTNAFSEAGLGFGYTKATRWHGIRIDHVLAADDWQCLSAWVGPHLGGDHRPMVADLRLRKGD